MRKLIFALAVVGCVLCWIVLSSRSAVEPSTVGQGQGQGVTVSHEAARHETAPASAPDQTQPVTSTSPTERAAQMFQISAARYAQTQRMIGEEANALLKELDTEANLILSQKVLTQPKSESSNTDPDARLLAIDLLGYHARERQDPSQVEDTIQSLNQLVLEGKGAKGVEFDLTDLTFEWIKALGPDHLREDPQLLVSRLGYKKELRPYYATALRYAFPKEIETQEFVDQFKLLLTGDAP